MVGGGGGGAAETGVVGLSSVVEGTMVPDLTPVVCVVK